jgi:steroid 5-alpha reductase family enzyme
LLVRLVIEPLRVAALAASDSKMARAVARTAVQVLVAALIVFPVVLVTEADEVAVEPKVPFAVRLVCVALLVEVAAGSALPACLV